MTLRPMLVVLLALGSCAGTYAADSAPVSASSSASAQTATTSQTIRPTAIQGDAALLSARFLTRFHYESKPLDEAMSARIYKAYFDLLDGEKVFFTQADMTNFEPMKTHFNDAIWNKDLSAPFAVANLYVQRAIERMNYAHSLLAKGFDFSKDESYNLDRKEASWPKDQSELDDLWRKRVKNEWLRLKLAGKGDDEIRKVLDKRYAGYIERTKQLDGEDVFQTFMTAYAHSTDPHTDYMGPRQAENFDISMKLSLEGIGALLQARDEYTTIREVIPGGPAAKSGKLHPGDSILAVGQGVDGPLVDVVGWRLDDVVNKIRGSKDTVVRLEILPAAAGVDGKPQILSLVRKKVSIEEQAAKKKLITIIDGGVSRKIGVIELPQFYSDFGARSAGDKNYRSASRDVAKLIEELKADGAEGLIVDLRNNGGGSLAEANEMSGLFVGEGPDVQVRDARGQIDVQGSNAPKMSWSGPLAVLVNRGSASASEIFAAAMQDYGRALIIGQPTFGKGTVQNLVELDRFASPSSDKKRQLGELKMTIAEFFRISGGSTQLKGVTPDILYPRNGEEKDFGESSYDNALSWTQIKPAQYNIVANQQAWLAQLTTQHEARVAKDPRWQLMLDEMVQARKLRDQKAISLNFAKRKAERKQLDAIQADFRARHKVIDGEAGLENEQSALDDGLNYNERSLKEDLKLGNEAKKTPDPQLQETAHIVSEAIALLRNDTRLAVQVLPFGGKFSVIEAPSPALDGQK